MHDLRAPRILTTLLLSLPLATAGCSMFSSHTPATPTTACEQVFEQPAVLRQRADELVAEKKPELAYRYLALLETLHPDSPESREAFPLAAALFKKLFFFNRTTHPNSVWATSEPVFMYQWVAHFFGDESPQEQVELLFLGMPYSYFLDFKTYAAKHPELSRWVLQATKDNGLTDSIRVEPAAKPGA